MGKIKIEKLVNNCNDCAYLCRMHSQQNGSAYAAICVHNSMKYLGYIDRINNNEDVEAPKKDILLMVSLVDDTKHYAIDIPKNCPLEDYLPLNKSEL